MTRPQIDPNRAFGGHDRRATRDEILSWVRDFCDELGFVPPQKFGKSYADLEALPDKTLKRALPLLYERPDGDRVREVCGSWFQALVDSGVLGDDTQRMGRGTRVLANDGCRCQSLAERTIDDLLSSAGIAHEREVPYPESRMRCDWKLGDVYVEYLGLVGDPVYDAKSRKKDELARRLGIRLLTILPGELTDLPMLQRRIMEAIDHDLKATPATTARRLERRKFTYIPRDARRAARAERNRERSRPHIARGAERFDAGVLYKDEQGLPHREGGPARIWDNDRVAWCHHGWLHRSGGPAKYGSWGSQQWYRDGVRHRDGAPAHVEPKKDGGWFLEWHEHGHLVRRERRKPHEEPLPSGWYVDDPGPLD